MAISTTMRSGMMLRNIAAANMKALAEVLAPLQLRPVEATVLQIVAGEKDVTQASIGRMVGVAAPNLCPIITRLAERKLIRRLPRGRRTVGLTITPAGQKIVSKLDRSIELHDQAFIAKLPAELRRPFLAALSELWKVQCAQLPVDEAAH